MAEQSTREVLNNHLSFIKDSIKSYERRITELKEFRKKFGGDYSDIIAEIDRCISIMEQCKRMVERELFFKEVKRDG
ncbi:hypothetical protein [uncultured Clostridium sp.]|uniref:hypothetical protein n=1 Tax=uncultured Clostridium sp. TaxID=59620 RepID=UPI0025E87864|nr:hypothetical protein [uncultured Clostridium sp.]